MTEKPSLREFIRSAGSGGIVSTFATAVLFTVTVYEHPEKHDTPALILLILAGLFFCWGAYLAWSNERRERLKVEESIHKADIRGEIYRASIDTKRFDEHGQVVPIEDGICVSLLMKAVNHGHDAWSGKWPTLEISFGGKTYQGESTRVPELPFLLQYDDMSLFDRRVQGLFQSVFVNGPQWPHGLPRVGTLSFIVPGVDHNVMKTDLKASIRLTFFDSLDNSHPSDFEEVALAKGLIQLTPKA
jgi:hypothetical protein